MPHSPVLQSIQREAPAPSQTPPRQIQLFTPMVGLFQQSATLIGIKILKWPWFNIRDTKQTPKPGVFFPPPVAKSDFCFLWLLQPFPWCVQHFWISQPKPSCSDLWGLGFYELSTAPEYLGNPHSPNITSLEVQAPHSGRPFNNALIFNQSPVSHLKFITLEKIL